MATKPGDGRTNPMGDGHGNTSGSRAAPVNFLANPKGSGKGSEPKQNAPQAEGTGDTTINADSVVAGGLVPLADPPQAEDIGTRAIGQNANKPYKLGG